MRKLALSIHQSNNQAIKVHVHNVKELHATTYHRFKKATSHLLMKAYIQM
jgi:hypothetical protein